MRAMAVTLIGRGCYVIQQSTRSAAHVNDNREAERHGVTGWHGTPCSADRGHHRSHAVYCQLPRHHEGRLQKGSHEWWREGRLRQTRRRTDQDLPSIQPRGEELTALDKQQRER